MTTNHPISKRILSLFTIIILLFGLVGCNSNVNNGQDDSENTNKEQYTTYTADYKWWENCNDTADSDTYFVSHHEEFGTRYIKLHTDEYKDGTFLLSFYSIVDGQDYLLSQAKSEKVSYSTDFDVHSWSYNWTNPKGDEISIIYMLEDNSLMVTSSYELYNIYGDTPYNQVRSGIYIPTAKTPSEITPPNTDNSTSTDNSTNTNIDVDFNVNVDERILVSGTIMSTGNLTIAIGKYCLELDEPITIQLNDPYFADSSKIYECSTLYFYDDTELIDSSENTYYLTDDDIGKKCSIFARIEDYRDGGDLYFLYPEIWFD